MPRFPLRKNESITFAVPGQAGPVTHVIPGSELYLGFLIQNVGVEGPLIVELSLDGTNWATLDDTAFVLPVNFAAGVSISIELQAPARGGLRLRTSGNCTHAGVAVVSMANPAFPS